MASQLSGTDSLLTGTCPDEQCHSTLFFPQYDSSIECTGCGQRHNKSRITDVRPVTDHKVALHNMLKNIILGKFKPKKGTDSVKVLGVSNYQCKLLSPLLTKYGMDKTTGRAKLLTEMQPPRESFDCSILGDRAFRLEPEHIEVNGYGRDRTGSNLYLKDTLDSITKFNKQECLIPIHADGDGHCLVHAISRALIGRELFWHALRENLKDHLVKNIDRYQALFADFVESSEWNYIIDECDPQFRPVDGDTVGLRNIHIFGLANVLRRPIILLDSLSGIQSSGDYSGIFLPGLYTPADCSKGGVLNKPLCVAWSSAGRNHYIALVGIRDRCLPRIPAWMVPKVYGMNQDQLDVYIKKEPDGSIVIGGDKSLTDKYILRLVDAMEEVFMEAHKVSTSCIADVHQYIYKSSGYVGVSPELVLDHTQRAVTSKQLFRCLTCEALTEHIADPEWFKTGGILHKLAVNTHKTLDPTKQYSFPVHGYICSFDAEKNELIPIPDRSQPSNCQFCQGTMMRHISGDGSIVYINGDRTKSRSNSTKCQCGYKHYWGGQEYDNVPEIFPLTLDWGGKTVRDTVDWFQYETDPSLNSNVFEVAQQLVQKHFPGEFGSERLVQKVVDTILRQTAHKELAQAPPTTMGGASSQGEGHSSSGATWSADTASKIILTGQQTKSVHREELTKSTAELEVQKRIEAKAPHMQKRKTDEQAVLPGHTATSGVSDGKTSPKKQLPKQAKTTQHPSPSSSKSADAANQGSAQGSPVSAPPTPSSDKDSNVPKKVRVTTSDGRQLTLTLDPGITYKGLQERLSQELNVPGEHQKIKHGFPPKFLHPPPEGQEESPLHIQHGDKITVEITAGDTRPGGSLSEPEVVWPAQEPQRQSWSGFDVNAHSQSAQSMLHGLEELQHHSQDSLDTAIASLSLMATLMGKDLWSYVQGMPHLFSVGGLFYQQTQRDLGLTDGKHCTLPALSGKVFRYSKNEDRLELCLEPHGHFPVEPGIEKRVLKSDLSEVPGAHGDSSRLSDTLSSGSSGIVVNKQMQIPGQNTPRAFSGQGHSLLSGSENIRMPHDLVMHPHRQRASSFHELHHDNPAVIEEEEEVSMDTDKKSCDSESGSSAEPAFKRIGPGVTVLNHESENTVNNQAEMFHALASQIEDIVRDAEREDVDDHLSPVPSTVTDNISEATQSSDKPKSSEPMDST